MSAIISTVQKSGMGYSATEVAKAVFYFLPIDSNIEDCLDYPLDVPSAGTIYSYEVWVRFRCDVAPSLYCKNFKIWTSGSLPAGQRITINSSDVFDYIPPVNSKSIQGTRADLLNYTSSNKLPIAGELNKVGDETAFMVFQLELDADAGTGLNDLTIFYEYEEL